MQWSCPHCGSSLALGDNHLGSGWSFSKCFKCGGFALIRRAEINVIKVDKAPPGEPILLPEARENPSIAMMGAKETKKLEDALWKSNRDPLAEQKKTMPPITPFLPFESIGESQFKAPPIKKPQNKMAFGFLTGSTALFLTGFYLYMEAEEFWQKPKKKRTVSTPQKRSLAAQPATPYLFKVTPRGELTEIRSGPSLDHPVITKVNPTSSFLVNEWKDQWFNIVSLDTQQPIGWIQNDHVKTEPF